MSKYDEIMKLPDWADAEDWGTGKLARLRVPVLRDRSRGACITANDEPGLVETLWAFDEAVRREPPRPHWDDRGRYSKKARLALETYQALITTVKSMSKRDAVSFRRALRDIVMAIQHDGGPLSERTGLAPRDFHLDHDTAIDGLLELLSNRHGLPRATFETITDQE